MSQLRDTIKTKLKKFRNSFKQPLSITTITRIPRSSTYTHTINNFVTKHPCNSDLSNYFCTNNKTKLVYNSEKKLNPKLATHYSKKKSGLGAVDSLKYQIPLNNGNWVSMWYEGTKNWTTCSQSNGWGGCLVNNYTAQCMATGWGGNYVIIGNNGSNYVCVPTPNDTNDGGIHNSSGGNLGGGWVPQSIGDNGYFRYGLVNIGPNYTLSFITAGGGLENAPLVGGQSSVFGGYYK